MSMSFIYFIFEISLRFIDDENEKKIFFNIFIFCLLMITFSFNVEIKMLMKIELRYLLTFQILHSSISLTSFCHISHLHLFISQWNIHYYSFYIFSFSCLSYFFSLRRVLCACFCSFTRFLFHYILLNWYIFIRVMIFWVACCMIMFMSFVNLFIIFAVSVLECLRFNR